MRGTERAATDESQPILSWPHSASMQGSLGNVARAPRRQQSLGSSGAMRLTEVVRKSGPSQSGSKYSISGDSRNVRSGLRLDAWVEFRHHEPTGPFDTADVGTVRQPYGELAYGQFTRRKQDETRRGNPADRRPGGERLMAAGKAARPARTGRAQIERRLLEGPEVFLNRRRRAAGVRVPAAVGRAYLGSRPGGECHGNAERCCHQEWQQRSRTTARVQAIDSTGSADDHRAAGDARR